MIIKLPTRLYDKLVDQAQDEYPKECCGLVGGVEEEESLEIKEVFALTNVDDSAEHYSMDPKEQFEVVKQIREKDYELVANYHSHPHTPARPSAEDKRLAYDEELVYFILSLAGADPVVKAFRIKEQQTVSEMEIELI